MRARFSMSAYAFVVMLGLIALCLPKLSLAQDISGFVSDDFSATQLDTITWSVIDPRGDSSVSVDENQLRITVPAGTNHDMPNNGDNTSARVMQSIFNTDFELDVKFESPVQAGQIQGIIVEQEAGTYLVLNVYHNGIETRVQSIAYTNNVSGNKLEKVIADAAPIYLRVKREGNTWTHYFSYDGIIWNAARVLTSTLIPNSAGVLAGNFGGANAPEHTAIVDYMFSTATPVEPEDGEVIADNSGPYIRDIKKLAGANQFQVLWETDEAATSTIEYGTTSGYGATVDSTSFTDSHDLVVTGLSADTTYHFRLRSTDQAGNETVSEDFTISVSSNPYLDLWYGANPTFGLLGSNAQRWINIPGHVSGANTITSLEYSLNGALMQPLSLGADGLRLQDNNDFNADIEDVDLFSGANSLAITATDNAGNQTTESLALNYVTGNTWPLPYTINWSTVAKIENAAQIVDGAWELTGNGLRTRQTGYDRAIAIGDISWENYEVTVPVTLHGVDQNCFINLASNPCNGGPLVGVLMRWQGHHVTFIQPNWEWRPLGALGAYRWFKLNNRAETEPGLFMLDGGGLITDRDLQQAFPVGTTHIFKIRAESVPSGQSQYKVKMWPQGQAEPSQWDIEQTQEIGTSNSNGSLLLIAHYADATFGNVTVTSLDGTDTDSDGVRDSLDNCIEQSNADQYDSDGDGFGNRCDADIALPNDNVVNLTDFSKFRAAFGATAPLTAAQEDADFNGDGTVNLSDFSIFRSGFGKAPGPSCCGGGDVTPPVISNVQAAVTDTTVTITWNTNEAATSAVNYGLSTGYGSNASNPGLVTSHSITLTNLLPGTLYHFQASSTDANSNAANGSDATFTTNAGAETTPPVISNVQAAVTDSTATITWNTNEAATSAVNYGLSTGYGSNASNPGLVTSHSITLTNLLPGTLYHFQASSTDANSNAANGSDVTFTTNAGADTTPPVISNVQVVVTDSTATITWNTNEAATSAVNYGLSTGYGSNASNPGLVTSHSITLTNLLPGTLYHFQAISTDANSNAANGSDATFTTNAGAETTPPVISNVQAAVTDSTATITWITNEATSSLVEYGVDTNYGMSSGNPALVVAHNANLNSLVSGSPYHYRITATDASGNITIGEDQTFTTSSTNFPSGLVFSVPMHEGAGNTVFDNSGNSQNGTLVNGPAWAGTTLSFDGVNDYVNMGNLDIPGSALTLMGRVRADNLANCAAYDCRIISKAAGTATDDHYFMVSPIQVGSETRLRFRLKTNGITSTLVASSGDLQNNVWVHFAAVYDGANMLLYQDGVLVGSLPKTGSIDTDNTVALWLGGNPPAAAVRPWDGSISDVMVYNQPLTAQQIVDLIGSTNSSPVFTSTPVTTSIVGEAYSYNIVATDQDSADVLSISSPTLPNWLSFIDNGQGRATLSGNPPATGSYPVVLQVTDQNNAVAQQSFTIVVLDSSAATNLLVFDWNTPVTQAQRGFPWNDPPMASANGNWIAPINYAEGRIYLRAEIRSQPVAQTNRLQFCMWQYDFTLETCSSMRTVEGTPGNVVEWSQPIQNMWKLDGNPMDWANPRQRYGVAIKNASGLPVSNFSGWEWNGEDPTLWYPLDMRFTVVVVPKGGTFSGWDNFVN